jgi:restriction system protein
MSMPSARPVSPGAGEAPARPPNLVARLFWTGVTGASIAFWYGPAAFAGTGLALAAVLARHLDRPRRLRARVRRIARRHGETLALRRRQERFEDAYGNLIDDGWLRECDYFLDRTVLPQLGACDADLFDRERPRMLAVIEAAAADIDLPDEDEAPEDGIDYERFCAGLLTRAGWRTHRTPPSGDQGADVVAEREGIRLIVQCKRLGRPVGNAAVQEAAAALRYWEGDRAAVVSNAGFTPAARRLAGATGVLLLHHGDLEELEVTADEA